MQHLQGTFTLLITFQLETRWVSAHSFFITLSRWFHDLALSERQTLHKIDRQTDGCYRQTHIYYKDSQTNVENHSLFLCFVSPGVVMDNNKGILSVTEPVYFFSLNPQRLKKQAEILQCCQALNMRSTRWTDSHSIEGYESLDFHYNRNNQFIYAK